MASRVHSHHGSLLAGSCGSQCGGFETLMSVCKRVEVSQWQSNLDRHADLKLGFVGGTWSLVPSAYVCVVWAARVEASRVVGSGSGRRWSQRVLRGVRKQSGTSSVQAEPRVALGFAAVTGVGKKAGTETTGRYGTCPSPAAVDIKRCPHRAWRNHGAAAPPPCGPVEAARTHPVTQSSRGGARGNACPPEVCRCWCWGFL